MREQVARIVGVAVGARRRESQRVLEMLLGCRGLLRRIFGNGKINKEHRIERRQNLGTVEVIECSFVIAFRHQGVAIVH